MSITSTALSTSSLDETAVEMLSSSGAGAKVYTQVQVKLAESTNANAESTNANAESTNANAESTNANAESTNANAESTNA
jgi:hypothetical protein